VVVGLLAVYEFAGNESPQTVATSPAEDAPPAKARPAKKSAPAQSPSPAAAARPGAPGNPPEATAPIARHASPAALTAVTPAPAQEIATQPQERPATGEEREVRFVFDEESWVEVRDRNDTVIFYQLNASGTTRRVSGLASLTIVVGNAHGVRMTYAGQPVDLARHTKIDVARLTLE